MTGFIDKRFFVRHSFLTLIHYASRVWAFPAISHAIILNCKQMNSATRLLNWTIIEQTCRRRKKKHFKLVHFHSVTILQFYFQVRHIGSHYSFDPFFIFFSIFAFLRTIQLESHSCDNRKKSSCIL